jgi:hypothetical protein
VRIAVIETEYVAAALAGDGGEAFQGAVDYMNALALGALTAVRDRRQSHSGPPSNHVRGAQMQEDFVDEIFVVGGYGAAVQAPQLAVPVGYLHPRRLNDARFACFITAARQSQR